MTTKIEKIQIQFLDPYSTFPCFYRKMNRLTTFDRRYRLEVSDREREYPAKSLNKPLEEVRPKKLEMENTPTTLQGLLEYSKRKFRTKGPCGVCLRRTISGE